jgi:hypothetical protein
VRPALLGIGEFFLFAGQIAFLAIGESDAQLVGSPHDMVVDNRTRTHQINARFLFW